MPDRVPHDAVETVDATLGRHGGTRRPELRLPGDAADDFPRDEVVRLVLAGSEYRTRIGRRSDGAPVLRGAYDTPRIARDPGGAENHLAEWVDDEDLEPGRTVHVDVVEPGFKYGVRAPGESATYEATEPPTDSLASIARSLDE